MNLRIYIICLTLFLSAGNVSAIAAENDIQWYTYSNRYETYIPVKTPDKKISFFVDLSVGGRMLKISAPLNSAVFVNDRLLADFQNASPLIFDVDSLARVFPPERTFFTIYHRKSLAGLQTVILQKSDDSDQLIDPVRRKTSGEKDFYIFAIAVLLLTAGIIRSQASVQSVYLLSFRQIILPQVVENPFYSNSFFSREVVSFYIGLSMASGLLAVYFSENLGYLIPVPREYTFSILLLFWFLYSAGIYSLFWLKLVHYKFLTRVFNFRRYTLIQNYDFLRISIVFAGLAVFIMSIDLFVANVSLSVLWLFSILVLLIYLYTTYRKLNKLYSHTKLHLFSYLCVSEMVPWFFLTGILGN